MLLLPAGYQPRVGLWVDDVVGIEIGNPLGIDPTEPCVDRSVHIPGRYVNRWHFPVLADVKSRVHGAAVRNNDLNSDVPLAAQGAEGPWQRGRAVQRRNNYSNSWHGHWKPGRLPFLLFTIGSSLSCNRKTRWSLSK